MSRGWGSMDDMGMSEIIEISETCETYIDDYG